MRIEVTETHIVQFTAFQRLLRRASESLSFVRLFSLAEMPGRKLGGSDNWHLHVYPGGIDHVGRETQRVDVTGELVFRSRNP